jgi:hypothetical protein
MAENVHLMFLTSKYFEQGKAIRGASLVTDEKTRPIEFRCTSPIRPNDYQRTLYGNTLDEYIFVDLIGMPLIGATKENVDLVLVDDERFLSVRPRVDVPVILLLRSMEDTEVPAVVLKTYTGFETEKVAAQSRLASLFSEGENLTEPFERVRLALDQAHAQRIGDKNT